MDIHPPEHPIRSMRDFLMQIFTITCGILMALGLEQFVQWRHDEALAAQARADFLSEIAANNTEIRSVLDGEAALDGALRDWISYGEARMQHQAKAPPALAVLEGRGFAQLSTSAWEAAIATQAIAHLRFAETRALFSAYTAQQSLHDLTQRAIEHYVGLGGFGDPTKVPDALMPEELRVLRVNYGYARSIAILAGVVQSKYAAAEAELKRAR